MAKRTRKQASRRIGRIQSKARQVRSAKRARSKLRRLQGIGKIRLERGLLVFSKTKDIKAAAQAAGTSVERFKSAAIRKALVRNRRGRLILPRRLPRQMPLFSHGKLLAITVSSKSASLIGRYMSAVGQFLKTNDPKFLAECVGQSVKDTSGKAHQFETDPNVLYRLSSAANEPFTEIYRIVI